MGRKDSKMGRLLAIGDIHGCADTLESLLDQIMLSHDDKIVFMGDYIDRGNKVFQTVQRLIELREEYGDEVCTFIKGNHEQMFLQYLDGNFMDEISLFLYNGGTSTVNSYKEHLGIESVEPLKWDDLPESHQHFYDNLKVIHEDGAHVFVHAGIRPNIALGNQLAHDMIWIRSEFLYHSSPVLEGHTIIHGHTPMERKEIDNYNDKYPDRFNTDSACVFGYDLTCRDLTNGLLTRVKCRDKRVA
jgi:serine/threonine protein phosphatase 1